MRFFKYTADQPSREIPKTLTPAVLLLVLAAFAVAFLIADPAPPSHIRIGGRAADGAYYLFAQKYREILARDRITLEVRETAVQLRTRLDQPAPLRQDLAEPTIVSYKLDDIVDWGDLRLVSAIRAIETDQARHLPPRRDVC